MPRRSDGTRCIANNALVAITLLIAVCEPVEKGVIINWTTPLTVKEWLQCEGAATSVLACRRLSSGEFSSRLFRQPIWLPRWRGIYACIRLDA